MTLLGWALGLVVRLWLWTLRVEVVHPAAGAADPSRPWVYAFWHGAQLAQSTPSGLPSACSGHRRHQQAVGDGNLL